MSQRFPAAGSIRDRGRQKASEDIDDRVRTDLEPDARVEQFAPKAPAPNPERPTFGRPTYVR